MIPGVMELVLLKEMFESHDRLEYEIMRLLSHWEQKARDLIVDGFSEGRSTEDIWREIKGENK